MSDHEKKTGLRSMGKAGLVTLAVALVTGSHALVGQPLATAQGPAPSDEQPNAALNQQPVAEDSSLTSTPEGTQESVNAPVNPGEAGKFAPDMFDTSTATGIVQNLTNTGFQTPQDRGAIAQSADTISQGNLTPNDRVEQGFGALAEQQGNLTPNDRVEQGFGALVEQQMQQQPSYNEGEMIPSTNPGLYEGFDESMPQPPHPQGTPLDPTPHGTPPGQAPPGWENQPPNMETMPAPPTERDALNDLPDAGFMASTFGVDQQVADPADGGLGYTEQGFSPADDDPTGYETGNEGVGYSNTGYENTGYGDGYAGDGYTGDGYGGDGYTGDGYTGDGYGGDGYGGDSGGGYY